MAIGPASQILKQASAQALRAQSFVLSPAAADTLQRLRDLLDDSVERDRHPPLCDFSKDPADTWYPYGHETECRIRHVRSQSEFRQGIHYTFQHNWSTKQHDLNDELVDPIVKLVMQEGLMTEPEARAIVWNHYKYVYGHLPKPDLPTIPLDPSRTTMPLHPGIPGLPGGPPEGPLVPMPRPLPPEEGGFPAPCLDDSHCGEGMRCVNANCEFIADAPSQMEPAAPADEFPWMWVGIGAGALVLIGGGYYLATRKA